MGTRYKGWQKQKNTEYKTIQSVLEEKLKIVLREEIELFAAGRTDAGVHAKMQLAHFDINKEIKETKVRHSLNALLKEEDIAISEITKIPDDMHARFSCIMKEYRYQILVSHVHNVFLKNQYWLVPKFDIEKAQKCANFLIGTHDFSSFRDAQCQAKSPIRSIQSCTFEQNNDFVIMQIQAKSFLHHQIRIIIGTIFEIIARNQDPQTILDILNKKDRKKAGLTAPAKGLSLTRIKLI